MTIPVYNELLLPLLRLAADKREHHIRDAVESLANEFRLSETDRTTLMKNSSQTVFANRTHWANTYLKQARLLESTGRGTFRITQRGLDIVSQNPRAIDKKFLMQFDEFVAFSTRSPNSSPVKTGQVIEEAEQTPKELMQSLSQKIHEDLADELLDYILDASPAFFEKLVIDLLLAMGYGGSLPDAGTVMGRSGDGGIDGSIQEDKLGLSTIYVQAKRWDRGQSVGRKEIQAFVGSLMGQGATKGVFITTSRFSSQASGYVTSLPNVKVVLIDGSQLALLMIENNVGVAVDHSIIIKRVDSDYFVS